MINLDEIIKREAPKIIESKKPLLLLGNYANPAYNAARANVDLIEAGYTPERIIPNVWGLKPTEKDKKQYYCLLVNFEERAKSG